MPALREDSRVLIRYLRLPSEGIRRVGIDTPRLNNPLRYTDPDGENPVDENPDLEVRRTTTTTEVIVGET